MKKYLYIIPVCVLLSYLASCIEDKGNYNYNDINEVTISGIKEEYDIELDGTLRITPELEFSMTNSDDDFIFEWLYLNISNSTILDETVLYEGRNIDYKLSKDIFNKAQKYELAYKVTNKKTGIIYNYKFKLNVSSPFAVGYLAICEKKDGFDLDMVALFQEKLAFYPNILDMMESDLDRTNCVPLGIVSYVDSNSPFLAETEDVSYALFVLSDQGTDRLHPDDYSYEEKYNLSNISFIPKEYQTNGAMIFDKMQAVNINADIPSFATAAVYGYKNQNWFHYYGSNQTTNLFSYPINRIRETEEHFNTAPFIAASGQGALLYDIDKDRFIYNQRPNRPPYMFETKHVMTSIELVDEDGDKLFKWNQPNIDLIYMDNYPSSNYYWQNAYILVKNKSSQKYEYWQINLNQSLPQKEIKKEFENSIVGDADFFAKHYDSNYLYYATKERIYCSYIDSQSDKMLDVALPSDIIDKGHVITLLKFVTFKGRLSLALATYNPSGEVGSNATLKLYDIDSGSGQLVLGKHPLHPNAGVIQEDMVWTGFGKIVGLTVKTK